MKKEIWKDIPGYEGLYQVSNLGRVKNNRTGRILKPENSKTGYLCVGLSNNRKAHSYYVHRLVAVVFIPNPEGLRYINHRDQDKHNNCVENLEWCTQRYNVNYGDTQKKRVKSRTISGYQSYLNNRNSKPVAQYTLDGILVSIYPSAHEAERQTGFRRTCISNCCLKKQKTSYGFIWKYL